MQLVNRDDPEISTIKELEAYAEAEEIFNLEEYLVDPILVLNIYREDSLEKRSWDDLEDKYGRIVAKQIKVLWEYDDNGNSASYRGKDIDQTLSIIEVLLDPVDDFSSDYTEVDRVLSLNSCEGEQHLAHLDPIFKQ